MPLPAPDDFTNAQREKVLAAFWEHVDRTENGDECWNWTGNTVTGRPHGRMYVSVDGRIVDTTASRFAARWLLEADLGDGSVVTRRCGNPKCVRPSHLKACESKQAATDYREQLNDGGDSDE